MDTQLGWLDADRASHLHFKGMCKCKLVDGAMPTSDWLHRHVTLHTSNAFGKTIGSIFALPLLWTRFFGTFLERVQPEIRNGIFRQFTRLEREGFADSINPIAKVEVIPSEGARKLEEAHTHQLRQSLIHLHLSLSLQHHCHGQDECSTRQRHSR